MGVINGNLSSEAFASFAPNVRTIAISGTETKGHRLRLDSCGLCVIRDCKSRAIAEVEWAGPHERPLSGFFCAKHIEELWTFMRNRVGVGFGTFVQQPIVSQCSCANANIDGSIPNLQSCNGASVSVACKCADCATENGSA